MSAPDTLTATQKVELWQFLCLCHGIGTTPERAAAVYVEDENPSARLGQVEEIARYAWKDFDRLRDKMMARRPPLDYSRPEVAKRPSRPHWAPYLSYMGAMM